MKTPFIKSAVTLLSLSAALCAGTHGVLAHTNSGGQEDGVGGRQATDAQTTATAAADNAVVAGNEQGKGVDANDGKRGQNANRNEKIAQNRALAEERRAMFAARMREMLTKAGFPDVATQDAIIEFIASEEKSKGGIRDATRRLGGAIRREVPPERMRDLLTEYKAATEAEKVRKEAARAALDTKIGYSKNPRLEAILLISGILGDGAGFRYELLMQRPGQGGQGGGYNGPQNGAPRGMNGNPDPNNGNPNANPNGNGPRAYPGGRDRSPVAPAPELKPEPPAQPPVN